MIQTTDKLSGGELPLPMKPITGATNPSTCVRQKMFNVNRFLFLSTLMYAMNWKLEYVKVNFIKGIITHNSPLADLQSFAKNIGKIAQVKGMLRPIFCVDINTNSDRK